MTRTLPLTAVTALLALIPAASASGATAQLDPAFGSAGWAVPSRMSDVTSLALQPDGRIVAAGQDWGDVAVARLTADGVSRICLAAAAKLPPRATARKVSISPMRLSMPVPFVNPAHFYSVSPRSNHQCRTGPLSAANL